MKPRRTSCTLAHAILLLAFCCARCAGSIGAAKRDVPDGQAISFQAVSVTAVFPGAIYVEQADRSAGIRVNAARTFEEGDVVNVEGIIETDPQSPTSGVSRRTRDIPNLPGARSR